MANDSGGGGIERESDTLKKLALRRLVWVMADVPIRTAAKMMHLEGVSSVVVVDGRKPVGILTDSDLREVVANGVDVGISVGEYLRAKPSRVPDLITVEVDEKIHETLSKMLEHRIKHTLVTEGGRVRGVVTIGDLAYRLGPFHLYYVIRMRRAKDLSEIKETMTEFKDEIIKRALTAYKKRGGMARSTMFYESISQVVDAALIAVTSIKGGPPGHAVYAATGSWGRREQFVLTDRDTILVYEDGSTEGGKVRSWVEELEESMDEVGFPPCQHGYTARKLLFGRKDMLNLIDRWSDDPQRFAVEISIIADSRAVLGDGALLEEVKSQLTKKLHKNRLYLSHSLMYKPPISPLGIPKSFDFKSKAVAPLEYPVRALAVTNGITATSTSERIEQLGEKKVISSELRRELLQSYDIIMGFKITSQLLTQGTVETSALTPVEVGMMKEAMKTVKLFQSHIERAFI
ncbi:MAG: putative nucleotidyltransferase substrate binding domain-containing protein [Candidatus Verstraetearchaeota archaeon]|nr:putative nucleotidyltransferase substrate binding domain-containing protein [Candidatus Verstraetearchaeota archaeon]